MADHDAASGQHLFHHAQAQRKAEVEPHDVADDLGRDAIRGMAGANWRYHTIRPGDRTATGKPAEVISQVDGAY